MHEGHVKPQVRFRVPIDGWTCGVASPVRQMSDMIGKDLESRKQKASEAVLTALVRVQK